MDDVDDARELVEQRTKETGIEEDIFDRVDRLLETFDTDREKLFEEMLDRIEAPGWDGLRDRWETNCEQADALLERLADDMYTLLKDSQANSLSAEERMTAVGPHDFLQGERKIWEQAAKGDIPDAATLIGKVLDADLQVIRKCDEDLRKVREGDKFVDALIVKNFGSITEKVKAVLVKYSVIGGPRLMVELIDDPAASDMAKEMVDEVGRILEENWAAAQEKRKLKEIALENIKLLTGAREQLSEEWIDRLYEKGASAARDLSGVGRSGEYEADDWKQFGDACVKALDERRRAAKEQSHRIYGELLPTFISETGKAFADLTDDPEVREAFLEELEDTFGELEDVFRSAEEYRATLSDGAYKESMRNALMAVWPGVTRVFELIKSRTGEAAGKVKE